MTMSRYSETVMDHFQSPRNWGRLEIPDGVGVAGTPGRSGYVVLQLAVSAGCIAAVRFQSHGCGATIAAGSMLTEMILGQTPADCRLITAERLLSALDGLPPDKLHCTGLAVRAMWQALDDLGTA